MGQMEGMESLYGLESHHTFLTAMKVFVFALIVACFAEEIYEFNQTEDVIMSYDMHGVKVDMMRRGQYFVKFRRVRIAGPLNQNAKQICNNCNFKI